MVFNLSKKDLVIRNALKTKLSCKNFETLFCKTSPLELINLIGLNLIRLIWRFGPIRLVKHLIRWV